MELISWPMLYEWAFRLMSAPRDRAVAIDRKGEREREQSEWKAKERERE